MGHFFVTFAITLRTSYSIVQSFEVIVSTLILLSSWSLETLSLSWQKAFSLLLSG